MRTPKLILVSFGVTLYAILVCALLSTVYWRSACQSCGDTSCALHKVAAGLLLSVVVTCCVVPFFFWFWLRCVRCFTSWAYTLFGGFLVSNATVVTSAATIVIIVEQFMCPTDKAVEFAAVVLIFVTQVFSGIVVEEVYIQQHEEKIKETNYKHFKNAASARLTSDEVRDLEQMSEEEEEEI